MDFPLKGIKGITITNYFQQILDESNHDSEFYNRSMKSWLEKNNIEIYSTHIEGKPVAAEKYIRTLKNKIDKYMTSISKNVYIDELDDIVNKYNNTYHITIKMKPIDVKSNTYINDKNPKLIIGDNVRISKHKNVFLQEATFQIGLKKLL